MENQSKATPGHMRREFIKQAPIKREKILVDYDYFRDIDRHNQKDSICVDGQEIPTTSKLYELEVRVNVLSETLTGMIITSIIVLIILAVTIVLLATR